MLTAGMGFEVNGEVLWVFGAEVDGRWGTARAYFPLGTSEATASGVLQAEMQNDPDGVFDEAPRKKKTHP